MRTQFIRNSCTLLTLGIALWGTNALADDNVKITSPADGSKVKSSEPVNVIYDITPNPGGDHAHIYVNDKEAGILRKLKSSFSLDPLPAGDHTLCVKVVNRGHSPIGQENCVKITSN